MKRLCLLLIAVLFLASGVAFAASKVGMFGGANSSGTAPMEVDSARAITIASDATFTNAGTTSLTGTTSTAALTATSVEVDGAVVIDGTIYTATLAVDGAIYMGQAPSDPCATLGVGYLFFNTSGEPCYCNEAGADIKVVDGTTACF